MVPEPSDQDRLRSTRGQFAIRAELLQLDHGELLQVCRELEDLLRLRCCVLTDPVSKLCPKSQAPNLVQLNRSYFCSTETPSI